MPARIQRVARKRLRSKFNGFNFGRQSAILLIDMQRSFVLQLDVADRVKIVARQRRVLTQCIKHNTPVVILEFRGYGATLPSLMERVAKVPRTFSILKEDNDGFENTELHELLSKLDVTSILLMGINASYCVLETAKSAIRLSYSITTAGDLIADPREYRFKSKEKGWYATNGRMCRSLF